MLVQNDMSQRQFQIAKGILYAIFNSELSGEVGYDVFYFNASDFSPEDCTVEESIEVGKILEQRQWVELAVELDDSSGYVLTALGISLYEKLEKMRSALA